MNSKQRPMKRRSALIVAGIVALTGLALNHAASRKAKAGLRVVIDGPAVSSPDETFRFVGSSTRHTLAQFWGTGYDITVLPFDWHGHELRVTHTAFIRSGGR